MEGSSRGFPRDLLGKFSSSSCAEEPSSRSSIFLGTAVTDDSSSGEIELSLGLSLNGCFGVEPKEKKQKLLRSSSIASFSVIQEHDFMALTRTCSLPTETEEELWKRKEMQSLKRLEAKRKRIEKKTSLRHDEMPALRTKSGKVEFEINVLKGSSSPIPGGTILQFDKPRNGVHGWVTTDRKIQPQRSIGSQGSVGSSNLSELENNQSLYQEEWSPSIIRPLQDQTNKKVTPVPSRPIIGKPKASQENPSGGNGTRADGVGDMERNVMEEMPCVTTKGEGPNGKRIEGFLYRYKKGEEIRIVCVCHGSFLTPAEFVRHAGGGDVDHPLRHIVVYPTPATFS